MSDTTDAVLGATTGLMSVAILSNVAANLIKGKTNIRAVKPVKIRPVKKIKW